MSDSPSLTKRAMKAVGWGYLGAAGKLVIQLGAQVALARLLGPKDYGLFAIGSMVVGLSIFFADTGIGSVLVQKKEIDDDLIRFISGCQWIAGAAVMAVLWFLAPPLAEFFNTPSAVDVIRAMSFVCLIGAISSVPSNLLRRRLEFKSLQFAQLRGFFIGYVVVGIPCAWYGAGVWSLVFASVSQATVTCVFVFLAARPPLGLSLRASEGRAALKFGAGALVSNMTTWGGTNVDKVIVGRYFPTYELGLYNAINNLLSTAVTQVLSTLQAVLFSAYSRANSDRDQLGRSYLLLVEAGALLFLPVFGCVAVIPDVVLVGLYGPQWLGGSSVLPPIALAMAAYGLAGLVTPLLWAAGKVQQEGRIQLLGAVFIAISSVVAARYGELILVAWAVCACVALRAFWSMSFTARMLSLPLPKCFSSLLPGLACAVLLASVLLIFCDVLRRNWTISPHWILLTAILFGSFVYILSAIITIRLVGSKTLNKIIVSMPMAKYFIKN